jgi:ABC-type transport system involved in multi-copper enzyme maturation permease subunit
MKPYFAVLFDSFLESIRSKVLWILLIAWTLILAALFPLTISKGESYAFNNFSFRSPKVILDQLASASAGKGTRKQKAVYAKLDEDFQSILQQRQANSQRKIAIGKMIDSFNKMLQEKDLYDAAVWPTAAKRPELKELVEKNDRTASDTEKLNRGLIDLAFEGSISPSAGRTTWITYAGFKLGNGFPVAESQVRAIIESAIFPLVMRFGLGIGAMLVSIVITSPMIPDMFQTGSMHLLLSKPISRSFLFLTKVLGGCTFVAINIIYLLFGLFLIAGLRLEIWNVGILWCIPLFIFTFLIFYSVSALTGLIWKNAIICVVVTAMFWAICFSVGLFHFLYSNSINVNSQTKSAYVVNQQPILSTQQGRLRFWNEETTEWKTAFGEVDGQKILGPVWIEKEKAIYFGRPNRLPFGMSLGLDTRLEFAHLPDFSSAKDAGFKSKPWDDGRLDSGPDLPPDTISLFPWKETMGVFTADGIYRFDSEASSRVEQQKSVLGNFGLGLGKNLFQSFPILTPKDWGLKKPMDIGIAPSFERIVVYSHGEVVHFQSKGDQLEEVGRVSLDIPTETVAIVAANDKKAIVCPIGMVPRVIDLETMSISKRLDSIGEGSFSQIQTDTEGRFALVSTLGRLWTVDAGGEQCVQPSVAGQGSVLAVCFGKPNQLWVAHARGKLDLVDLSNRTTITSIRPKSTPAQLIFDYIVDPFYQVNPKPSAMNDTIEYLLKRDSDKPIAIDRGDLELPKIALDPWTPIWTNSLFIAVMLSISSWYLYRQDL